MYPLVPALLTLLAFTTTSEASMSERILPGTVLDQRITACGIVLSTGGLASIRPFIETSTDFSGTVKLSVTKRSGSGTSQTSQGWNFQSGSLGSSSVQLDVPASVSIEMLVTTRNGAGLCSLEQDLDLISQHASA